MKMPRLNALVLVSLAALCAPAFGQGANHARPGTLNYVEGQASIDGRQVSSQSVGTAEVEAGQYLATADGKAEILLTPGVFLRLDKDSSVKMVSPDLTHTEVLLDRGRASVEADQLYPQNTILIDQKGGQTQLLKNGFYEFNADDNTVRTFDGKAAVYRGDDLQSKVKPIDVKGGRQLALNGEMVKPTGFDKNHSEDDLYNWSSLRSDYLGEANVDLAAQYASYGPGFGGFYPGWYWDADMYAYDWLPGGGPFWSPFGFGFYSPYYLYGGGFVYGRGFYGRGYGYHGGYGFSGVHGGYAGGHAVASGGFHGGEGGGGFHGGGGGGFHGGGGGGGHGR
jgi:FecR protein